ncbi:baseplate J/gp47 family protein [Chromobacterium sp. IIBBL 290-4]|uniref:baseplate J/gp47 family protein n=1 Tax=Chromobacterium sp. IIBBL 290-4 TaxID=2953890 RepID=UPI0020B6CC72|nr:baseplate J/gp47 family protein [Chromobacterium sp. IIBBL 290-4]UTH76016.1 baseplate J/gp47 family protein [Chromobacterium sp. IIBBL 290-4]
MPLSTPDFAALRDAWLRDLQNLRADAALTPDSDNFVRASVTASAVEGLYQHQSWIARQIFPDTADSDNLEQHARLRGLSRKGATPASGWLQIDGKAGAMVPAGLQVRVGDQLYVTQAADPQGNPAPDRLDANGQAIVPILASQAGTTGSQPDNLPVELMQAPSGVRSPATLLKMNGGADPESDAALLDRLLELIRRPPAGGNRYDYRRWAMEVDGVGAAYVLPLDPKQLGQVVVAVTGVQAEASEAIRAAAERAILDKKPVTATCRVILPKPVPVDLDLAVALDGVSLNDFTIQLNQALNQHFAALEPGKPLYRSQLETLISNLPGVRDRLLRAPAANVSAASTGQVEWLRLGKVAISPLGGQ